MKYSILILCILLSATSSADFSFGQDASNDSSLFIIEDSLDQLAKVDSVTYLRLIDRKHTDKKANKHTIRVFKEFSEIIGISHGGVILSEADPFEKTLTIIGHSHCEFQKITKDSIIYEDLKKKKCFYFNVNGVSDLNIVLARIVNSIKSNKDMHLNELGSILEDIVNEYSPVNAQEQIKQLIAYLLKNIK